MYSSASQHVSHACGLMFACINDIKVLLQMLDCMNYRIEMDMHRNHFDFSDIQL